MFFFKLQLYPLIYLYQKVTPHNFTNILLVGMNLAKVIDEHVYFSVSIMECTSLLNICHLKLPQKTTYFFFSFC